MSNTYKCAACHKTFNKGWSDEAAEKELKVKFDVPKEACDLVCDDCYKLMGLK